MNTWFSQWYAAPGDVPGPKDLRLAKTKTDGARPNAATLQSMHRGMLFLELLSERPMRAKELADATDTKWTTAHRTLAYLRDHDYVWRDTQSGLHYVGRRMFSIGMSYLDEHAKTFFGPVFEPFVTFRSEAPGTPISLDGTNHGNGYVNTGVLDANPTTPFPKSERVTFTKPGTYAYYCAVHGNDMKGEIVVQ